MAKKPDYNLKEILTRHGPQTSKSLADLLNIKPTKAASILRYAADIKEIDCSAIDVNEIKLPYAQRRPYINVYHIKNCHIIKRGQYTTKPIAHQKPPSLEQRLISLLIETGPMNAPQMTDRLGVCSESIYRVMRPLLKNGQIIKHKIKLPDGKKTSPFMQNTINYYQHKLSNHLLPQVAELPTTPQPIEEPPPDLMHTLNQAFNIARGIP